MKTNIFLKFSLIVLLALVAGEGWGQSLLVDDFTGTSGTNLSANGWTTHSGSGTPLTIATPGLTYSGYLSSGVGNATSVFANNEDVNKAFTSTNSGALYYSFMVNANPTNTTVAYPIHFATTSGASVTVFYARFNIQDDGSDNLRFGISKYTGSPSYTGYSYVAGTTYFIVVKYTFNTGSTTDDVVEFFVNPTPGSTEPTATISLTETSTTDATALTSICLRQSSTATPLCTMDGIRVGTTWASVTPASATNDVNSVVSAGATGEPATIASTVDTDGERILVFDVTFTDAGTADGFATIIDQIVFTQGSANGVADWTNAIAGAKLCGPDLTCGGSDLAGTVVATTITFSGVDFISIADGANETYQLKIWLQTDLSGITDNDILEFKLDFSNITCDVLGSSFGSGTPESGDANVSIDIDATKLIFSTAPSTTVCPSTNFTTPPVISAVDKGAIPNCGKNKE